MSDLADYGNAGMSAKEPIYPLSGDIICALPVEGAITSAALARQFGFQNVRKFGALLRSDLLRLEKMGLVRKLDDLKPSCWQALSL